MTVLQCANDIKYVQYLSTIIASLGAASMGTSFSWSSPSIPMLTSSDSPIGVQLTHEQASWVASCFPLGMIPGSILAGVSLSKIGHKNIFFCCSVLFLTSWILVTVSNSLTLLVTGRIIGGLAGGAQISILQLYVGEIADKNIRGKLAVFPTANAQVGLLIGLGIGPFVSFQAYSIICAVIALVYGVTVLFIPQSPYFLMKKDKEQDAQKSLQMLIATLRTKNKNEASLQEIRSTIEYQTKNKFTIKKLLVERRYRNSLLMVIVIKTLSDFSGGYAINSYVQTVLDESNSSLSPEVASLIYGVIQVVSIFSSAFLIDKVGRKPLSIVSSGGAALALISEGVYFYLKDVKHIDTNDFNFLPVLALCIYRLMVSLSLSSLPYVLVSELFSVDAKEMCALIFGTYSSILMFTNIKIFNPILEAAGFHTLFWIFSASCILAIVFVAVLLPETKGISFNAIQDKLDSKK
ncbi:hypothetical protein RN001_014018 [Aquatica leii]|uniref:Major facilitator superfamily (MFS) profile domain-containing protein n=1 Tax=Aquatica leii TaxID=1421715 RepID=A0AAN7P3K0_9COLE|nr:hypothetical protein RN001_014018 [Aquatica leii]